MATRFCTQCGQPIEGDTKFCTNCGAPIPTPPPTGSTPEPQQAYTAPQPEPQPAPQQPTGPRPNTYLVLAILATIFCCLPFGIVAIVQASRVDNLWNSRQYAAAQDTSRKARNWVIAAVATGLLVSIIYFILMWAGILAAGNAWTDLFNY